MDRRWAGEKDWESWGAKSKVWFLILNNAFRRGLLEEKLQQGLEVVREWAKWISKKRTFQAWERASTKAPGQSVSEWFKEQWGGLHSKAEWAGEGRGALDEVNETMVIIASELADQYQEFGCEMNADRKQIPFSLEFNWFRQKLSPFSSLLQISHSVVSNSLRPHGLQHTRPPCPSPTPCEFKLMSTELVMLSNHLILCRPFILLSSDFASIGIFSNESVLRIRRPKYWSFSFSISPSNGYSNWFPLGRTGWISL